VPTPLNPYREPDLSFVINTTESLMPYLRPGQLFALESTTYPGTTDEELKPRIEAQGLKVSEDVFLVFSPEREDPALLLCLLQESSLAGVLEKLAGILGRNRLQNSDRRWMLDSNESCSGLALLLQKFRYIDAV